MMIELLHLLLSTIRRWENPLHGDGETWSISPNLGVGLFFLSLLAS